MEKLNKVSLNFSNLEVPPSAKQVAAPVIRYIERDPVILRPTESVPSSSTSLLNILDPTSRSLKKEPIISSLPMKVEKPVEVPIVQKKVASTQPAPAPPKIRSATQMQEQMKTIEQIWQQSHPSPEPHKGPKYVQDRFSLDHRPIVSEIIMANL